MMTTTSANSLVTYDLLLQAQEMNNEHMDWYPDAAFPEHTHENYILAAYSDGIWIADTKGECCFDDFVKVEKVLNETWAVQ